MKFRKLNESWHIVEDATLDERLKITEYLSVYVPNYRFIPSVKAGIWDGRQAFYKSVDGNLLIPSGIIPYVCKKFNVEHKEDKNYLSQQEIDEFIKSLKLPFEPRDYQIEAFRQAIENKKIVLQAATAAGKSLMIYMIVAYLLSQNKRGIIVVPSVSLVEQLESDFKDYGAKFNVHKIYSGKEKEWKENILISTFQSLSKNLFLLGEADFIIVDETHQAKAESLQTILKYAINSEYKIGLTGTIPKEYFDKFSIICALGKIKKIITPRELIEKGYATDVEIYLVYLHYASKEKLKTYQEEIKFINDHIKRNEIVAKLALKLKNANDNTLLLYNTIKHGDLLLKLILSMMTGKSLDDFTFKKSDKNKVLITQYGETNENQININDYGLFYIRGDVKGDKREEIRKLLEDIDGGLILATYGTMSTGVNIKKLHNLIFASTTKSSIRLNQSIGRGMRKHESKDKVRLFDIIDVIKNSKKYAERHSEERIEQYLSNGYQVKEKDVYL